MFDRILMPTDGSDVSLAAAGRALALAKLAAAPLVVVYVHEPYPYAGIGAASQVGLNDHLAAGRQLAAAAFARVRADAAPLGVAVETMQLEGPDPASQIVEAARSSGADVIVMGSHGRTGIGRALLGSVAGKVLALSHVPVMVVK